MPLFRWRGVTKEGHWRSGRACALSRAQLEERMLMRGIAVTAAKPLQLYAVFMRPAPPAEQAASLETLAMLLESGVRLGDAALVTAEVSPNRVLQECWLSVAALTEQGKGLDENRYLSYAFGPLMVQLLLIGYRAGTLAKVARVGAWYARTAADLKRSLWNALSIPLITLSFVTLLLWGVFAFLIPSLVTLFSQWHATLPPSTQLLLTISEYARSPLVLALCAAVLFGVVMLIRFYASAGFSLFSYLPFIGPLYLQWQRVMFVQSLYALLDGGIALPDALNMLADVAASPASRIYAAQLAHAVEGGMTLSSALATIDIPLASPLMTALITVGQETNNLAQSLKICAERESQELVQHIRIVTTLMQPILIIGLGLVVLAVITAVYMPLMNIAQIVQ